MPVFPRSSSRHPARERGASLIESVLCLIALVLAGFAVFEIAQWHITRHLARLALHAAGREGAITHANPQTIRLAAEAILSPGVAGSARRTTARSSEFASVHGGGIQLSEVSRHSTTLAISGMRSWHLEILSPTTAMFSDFRDAPLSRARGRATIRNDFLAEQHAAHQTRGWANGIGPASGNDIFEANTLRLRLTVLYAPLMPGIGMIVRMMPPTGDPRADHARRRGMLAIVIEAGTAMHSHPTMWVDQPADRSGVVPEDKTGNSHRDAAGNLSYDKRDAPGNPSYDNPDTSRTRSLGRFHGELAASTFGSRPNSANRIAVTPTVSGSPPAPAVPVKPREAQHEHEELCGTLLCCPPRER